MRYIWCQNFFVPLVSISAYICYISRQSSCNNLRNVHYDWQLEVFGARVLGLCKYISLVGAATAVVADLSVWNCENTFCCSCQTAMFSYMNCIVCEVETWYCAIRMISAIRRMHRIACVHNISDRASIVVTANVRVIEGVCRQVAQEDDSIFAALDKKWLGSILGLVWLNLYMKKVSTLGRQIYWWEQCGVETSTSNS